jgi:hypothetical protein
LLVTASADKVVLKKPISVDTDLKIVGSVIWVGRSSIEIQLDVAHPCLGIQLISVGVDGVQYLGKRKANLEDGGIEQDGGAKKRSVKKHLDCDKIMTEAVEQPRQSLFY